MGGVGREKGEVEVSKVENEAKLKWSRLASL
jgi:hypothetical protein